MGSASKRTTSVAGGSEDSQFPECPTPYPPSSIPFNPLILIVAIQHHPRLPRILLLKDRRRQICSRFYRGLCSLLDQNGAECVLCIHGPERCRDKIDDVVDPFLKSPRRCKAGGTVEDFGEAGERFGVDGDGVESETVANLELVGWLCCLPNLVRHGGDMGSIAMYGAQIAIIPRQCTGSKEDAVALLNSVRLLPLLMSLEASAVIFALSHVCANLQLSQLLSTFQP